MLDDSMKGMKGKVGGFQNPGVCLQAFPSFPSPSPLFFHTNLVPRSLVDEAEGEIWPNPICITWSPVRKVTGEASAHAQHKFGAVKAKVAKADFVAYNKLTTGLRHDFGIFDRISKFHCFHETKQTQNEVQRFFLQLGRIYFRTLLRQ